MTYSEQLADRLASGLADPTYSERSALIYRSLRNSLQTMLERESVVHVEPIAEPTTREIVTVTLVFIVVFALAMVAVAGGAQ